MNIRQNGNALVRTGMLVAGVGLGAWLLAATPTGALVDNQQIMIGGNSMAEGSTIFTAPGLANSFGNDFPAAGLGESSAQVRLPTGTVNTLRVKLTTATAPSSGSFTLTVRKNGANTILTCSVTATGICNANGNVSFVGGDKFAVRVTNNFVGSGNMVYTYMLQFD